MLVFADLEPRDGDWYLNLLWFDRRKCLLLAHVGTLFPVFVADVRRPLCDPALPGRRARSRRRYLINA